MSSQPHIVLSWVVRRTRLPLPSLRCVACRSESASTGEARAELHGYRVNGPELVASGLLDPLLARLDHVSLTWKGTWRLNTVSAWLEEAWPVQVEVVFEDPVPVRVEWLGPTRNKMRRRIKCDVRLRRPTSAAFTFTATARAYRRGRRRRG